MTAAKKAGNVTFNYFLVVWYIGSFTCNICDSEIRVTARCSMIASATWHVHLHVVESACFCALSIENPHVSRHRRIIIHDSSVVGRPRGCNVCAYYLGSRKSLSEEREEDEWWSDPDFGRALGTCVMCCNVLTQRFTATLPSVSRLRS